MFHFILLCTLEHYSYKYVYVKLNPILSCQCIIGWFVSDRLALKDVLDAICEARSKWVCIGVQLNFTDSDLAAIAEECRDDPKMCLYKVIAQWLRRVSPSPPTWYDIIKALKNKMVDEQDLAQRIAHTQCLRFEDEDNACATEVDTMTEMTHKNEAKIMHEFSKLQLDVRRALDSGEARGTIADVHQYLVGVFRCDIPSANFTDMFVSITKRGLWTYKHYSPLENFIKEFLPGRKNKMVEYKNHLAGFQATTNLVHYMRKANLPLTDVDEEDSVEKPSSFSKNDCIYRELKIRLNLKRSLSDLSLKYVEDLWSDFVDEFGLPSLTAVIKRILEGSLEIVWLILPHVIKMIMVSAHKSTSFFRQQKVVYVAVDDRPLYDERLTVRDPLQINHFSLTLYSI